MAAETSNMTIQPSPGEAQTTREGLIFNIQRHSTEDGPGIRTTIFFKGCPMHCPWCHNPEGIKGRPEAVWYQIRCIGAKDCLEACPKEALDLTVEGMKIDREKCDGCGRCEEACPAAAIEVLGKWRTLEYVLDQALRDKVFYNKSGGGVTLSGGEPALQAEFSLSLMKLLKQEGVHLALDTCGGIKWERLEPLVNLADLILYDLKIMDEVQHKKFTGISLKSVQDNAIRISITGKPMWVRTPIIPGYTDSQENIQAISKFIIQHLPALERYDLLAFNNTCVNKYQRLDRAFLFSDTGLLSEEKMKRLASLAEKRGLKNIHWSGFTCS